MRKTISLVLILILSASPASVLAEDTVSAQDLITKAWHAQGEKKYDEVFQWTQKCIDLYQKEANSQHTQVKDYPSEEIVPLSQVAAAYFIQGEAFKRQDKKSEAREKFQYTIDNYRYAVAWDPSRGVYWKVAGVSQEAIDAMFPPASPASADAPELFGPATKVTLYDAGKEEVVDYEKYGDFYDIGTKEYKYRVKDQDGLSKAAGEGIYPNTTSARRDPNFKKVKSENRLNGSHWDFVQTPDLEAAFLKWITSTEPGGVKLYYTATILEKSGLLKHALKAYYAIVAHYPGAIGWTYWHTPWYIGPAAIAKINFILRKNPELGLKLSDARIRIINGYDNDISNDVVLTNPGRFERISVKTARVLGKVKEIFSGSRENKPVKRKIGEGKVRLEQYQDNSWKLLVENSPYTVKGVTYSPTKIGQSPDEGTLGNWMEEDFNKNGKIDGPYDSYDEKNPAKKIGDFQLLKNMGVNTIRLYHHPKKIHKALLNDLYKNYGIRVIMGDFLGKYGLGSKAAWNPGTIYSNEVDKKNMLESVKDMVLEYKDEPFILFWLLGNENVYGVACDADKDPDSFFKFVNEAALLIKSLDKEHPVAISSGDVLFLDRFAKFSPDVDIFGTNAYRGDYGFGNLWQGILDEINKPALITEFGCPAYARNLPGDEAEMFQARYHQGAWEDISCNSSVNCGAGNSLGGIIFEFIDEWWKAYEPAKHDTKGFFTGPFPDGFMHEEWLGVVGQGDGTDSSFKRNLRKSYYQYQKMWKK